MIRDRHSWLRRAFVSFFVLAGLSLSRGAVSQPLGFMLEGNYFHTDPSGQIQLLGDIGAGVTLLSPEIDLKDDLGFTKKGVIPFGVRLLGKTTRFELEYLTMNQSVDTVLTRAVVFQGINYAVTDLVASELRFRDISGSIRYESQVSPYMSVGAGIDIDGVRAEGTITDVTRSVTASETRNFIIPTGTLAVNLHDAARHIFVDVKASYISYQDSKAKKGRIEVGWAITENIGIKAGWRLLDVTYVKTRDALPDDRLHIKLDGYYGGVFLVF
ncbi:MAG: hypothetical protein ABIT01_16615 [Thermoanaerobaculia bacterium]